MEAPVGTRPPLKALPVQAVPEGRNPEVQLNNDFISRSLTSIDEIAYNITNCFHTLAVHPEIEKYKDYAKKLPAVLDTAAKFILEHFGDASGKKTHFILNGDLNDDYIKLMNWIIKNDFIANEAQEQYRTDLLARIRTKLERQFPNDAELVQATLLWLFSEPTVSFRQQFSIAAQQDLHKITEISQVAIKELINNKIESFCQRLSTVIDQRLNELVKITALEHAVRPLTKLTSARFLEIINNIPWTNFIDDTITKINQHTAAHITGVNWQNEWLKQPGNAALNDKDKETRKTEQYWRGFVSAGPANPAHANDRYAHWVVQRAINRIVSKTDPEKIQEQQDTDKFFKEMATMLADILFAEEMNTYSYWTQHLSIPQELKELLEEAKALLRAVTTDDLMNKVIVAIISIPVRNMVNSLVKDTMSMAKEFLIEKLASTLKAQTHYYTHPDTVKEMLGGTVIPICLSLIVYLVSKDVITANHKRYLDKWQKTQNDVEQKNEFFADLYSEMKKIFPLTQDFTDLGIGPEAFRNLMEKEIPSILNPPDQQYGPEQAPFPPQYETFVRDLLLKLSHVEDYKSVQAVNYGTMAWNLGARGIKAVTSRDLTVDPLSWAVTTMTNIFTYCMTDLRKSPDYIVNLTMATCLNKFSPNNVKNMLDGPALTSREALRKGLEAAQAKYEEARKYGDFVKIDINKSEIEMASAPIGLRIKKHPITVQDQTYNTNLAHLTKLIYDYGIHKIGVRSVTHFFVNPELFHTIFADVTHQMLLQDHYRNKSLTYSIVEYFIRSLASHRSVSQPEPQPHPWQPTNPDTFFG